MRLGPFRRCLRQLAEEGALPEWMADRQARARKTRECVLTATARLLERHPFPQVTMQDIAEEADISIGALYARFPSKEAVLALLGLAVFEDVRDRLSRALDAVPDRAGLRGVVRVYVDTIVTELRRFRHVLLALRSHPDGVPAIGALMAEAQRAMHQAFLIRARRQSAEIVHRDSEAALQFALFVTNAAAREAVLADALSHYAVTGGDRALRRALARSAVAYLRAG